MRRYRTLTPCRRTPPESKNSQMEQSIDLNCKLRKAKASLLWGFINVCLLGCVLYDLTYKCPLYTTTFNYIEYALVLIFSLNTLYHLVRYFITIIHTQPLEVTPSQRSLLGLKNADGYYKLTDRSTSTSSVQLSKHLNYSNFQNTPDSTYNNSFQTTPLNMTGTSWRSPCSNDSHNFSISSPSWVFYRGSPESRMYNQTPQRPIIPDTSGIDMIFDEKALQKYLCNYDTLERAHNASNTSEPTTNLLSTFWSHPATQSPNEISLYLRKAQYQLSQSNSSIIAINHSGAKDEGSPLNISQRGNEVWRRLQVEPHILTQWNANLRMWISQTIIERLVSEIELINEEFQKHYLNDVRIGYVGLERLRKTSQMAQVAQHIPTLTALIPFLEVTPNQEYLIKRLKELAKGGCMSEFKWNGGGDYNGKEWDDSLITDSAIIIHALATYLDSQLLPLPNQPDAKPFSKEHYIKMTDKVPQNPLALAIHEVSDKPPHFRLVVGEEEYDVAKGHNNLFHTILLFLFFVKKKEHGMLGKVNMGQSGVNMLWIIAS